MSTPLTIAARPNPLDAAPPSPVSPPSHGDPAGFASLLRQTQAAPASRLTTPPAPVASPVAAQADAAPHAAAQTEDSAVDEAPHPEPARPRARAPAAAKTRGEAATASSGDDAIAGPDPEAAARAAVADGERDTGHRGLRQTADAALDPSVLHWLAAQQRTAHDKAGASSASDEAQDPARGADSGVDPGAAVDAAARGGDVRAESRGRVARASPDAADDARAVTVAPDRLAGSEAGATAPIGAAAKDHAGIAAAPGAYQPATTPARDAAPALTVALPTPPNTPDFPRALGVQVSVFARDGVQHAELHLNPAEMGPVSVQIAMDGTRAHVQFGADQIATRQIIEAGMPELASALRDAGFTLAGGGVSQHSGGSRGGMTGDDDRRGDVRAAGEPVARAGSAAVTRRLVRAGGVDLYA